MVAFVWVAGCTSAPAATSALPSSPQPAGGPSQVTPTPYVLLPGSGPAPLTPVASVGASGVSLAPTPLATAATPSVNASVPILMYHQIKDLPANASVDDLTWTVSPAALDAQLGYLAEKGYTSISFDQLLDGFEGKSELPSKAVVITFDDGWKTQYTAALPLLKKYRLTATFYVVSSYMGYGAYFDWPMTKDVVAAGMTIGGHSIDHSDLTKKPLAEVDRQLRESKATLEKELGVTVTHFAYPYGAYNNVIIDALKRAGYRSATTLNPLPVKAPLAPYLLPRLRVSYKDTLADFSKRLP